MSGNEVVYVNEKGLRLDGRKVDELRPIKMEAGVLSRADGSCYIEWGQNKALVGVYGPREALPQHIQDPTKALVNFVYRMATFSVPERRNPRPSRRDIEISKVCGEALASAIFLERFPNTTIDIYVHIFDSNAGTRITALTAAAVAVADAGIPMRDLISGVAVGRAGGHIILDLTKEEEDAPDAVDMPVAMMPNLRRVALIQMDGLLTKEEWVEAMKLAEKGCKQVYEIQKNALKAKYLGVAEPEIKPNEPSEISEQKAELQEVASKIAQDSSKTQEGEQK
jgi:exosome complex component RRP41